MTPAESAERERLVLYFRWAYALNTELAKCILAEKNASADPGCWPAGQLWSDLGSSSREIFLRLARERAGVDATAMRDVVNSGDIELEDIFDAAYDRQQGGEG